MVPQYHPSNHSAQASSKLTSISSIVSPSLRRALDLPARTKITLENVHDFDPDPEAIAHWLRGAKKVECEAVDCTRAVYKTGNNMFCQIHTWSTKEGRAYQRRLRRNGGGDV